MPEPALPRRRLVLGSLVAALLPGLVPSLVPGLAAGAPAGPRVVALGPGRYLVEGWVLTAADLKALGLAAP